MKTRTESPCARGSSKAWHLPHFCFPTYNRRHLLGSIPLNPMIVSVPLFLLWVHSWHELLSVDFEWLHCGIACTTSHFTCTAVHFSAQSLGTHHTFWSWSISVGPERSLTPCPASKCSCFLSPGLQLSQEFYINRTMGHGASSVWLLLPWCFCISLTSCLPSLFLYLSNILLQAYAIFCCSPVDW